ncbi:hypothetical protein RJ639_042429 [Escallonia herrerae]|uniref:Acid phosphatase n=1 Tax=Escallonia herrerae TaxID=1293975 RepID=A0AA89B487_9ASTE|nr:hypothetical protein RJ639_042429 [Escallonia herrerae]
MNPTHYVVALLTLGLTTTSFSQSIIQLPTRHRHPLTGNRRIRADDSLYCASWRFSVETNDAGAWSSIPARCQDYVKEYVSGDRYLSDSDVVAGESLAFIRTVNVSAEDAGFESDKWSEIFDSNTFNEWVDLAEAPALPASLRFYKELQELGVTIFLLTGRDEFQRNVTVKNLAYAGYSNWERLFLREPSDEGKLATLYKSEKRLQIEDEGYTIQGSSGDQWSDLQGFAVAKRSFKLPNPMYYIA